MSDFQLRDTPCLKPQQEEACIVNPSDASASLSKVILKMPPYHATFTRID